MDMTAYRKDLFALVRRVGDLAVERKKQEAGNIDLKEKGRRILKSGCITV